jgi:putative transposase
MESTKTVKLKILNPNFALVEIMEKYSKSMNYISEVMYQKGNFIPARKLANDLKLF